MPYALPYLALVALATPLSAGVTGTLAYLALALALIPLASGAGYGEKENGWGIARWAPFAAIGIFAISRTLPLIRWGTSGLGADIAVYHISFERCFAVWSACAAYPIAALVKPFFILGVPTDTILIGLLIMANTALGFAIFKAANAYFGKEAAAWSALIFAASLPQFLAYWSFFLSMQIALALGFFGLVLWRRRSRWAAPIFLAQGIIHFITFIPFALALALGAIFGRTEGRKKELVYTLHALGVASLGILLYHAQNLGEFAGAAQKYATGAYGVESAVLLAGHFVTLDFYHNALMLFYLPFALAVCARAIGSRARLLAALAMIVPLMLAVSGIIFHNRFLIVFDAMAIMMAGEGMRRFLASGSAMMKTLILCAFALIYAYSLRESWRMEPLVNAAEFAEIKALRDIPETENLPIFVNNPLYLQFIAGYSGKEVLSVAFSKLPWKETDGALIYNAGRSAPFEAGNSPHYEQISENILRYYRNP